MRTSRVIFQIWIPNEQRTKLSKPRKIERRSKGTIWARQKLQFQSQQRTGTVRSFPRQGNYILSEVNPALSFFAWVYSSLKCSRWRSLARFRIFKRAADRVSRSCSRKNTSVQVFQTGIKQVTLARELECSRPCTRFLFSLFWCILSSKRDSPLSQKRSRRLTRTKFRTNLEPLDSDDSGETNISYIPKTSLSPKIEQLKPCNVGIPQAIATFPLFHISVVEWYLDIHDKLNLTRPSEIFGRLAWNAGRAGQYNAAM